MRNLKRLSEGFLFPADSDLWLGILRIGIAIQILLYCISLRADWSDLFSLTSAGLIKRDLAEAILSANSHFIPRIGWLVDGGTYFGLDEQDTLIISWWTLVLTGFCLLAGFLSRGAAIGAALLHLCAVKSTEALTYGVDNFTTIGLFYLMIAPLPDKWAVDSWLWRTRDKDQHRQGFHRRILQLHLCLIYFFGGITKCAGTGWWDGTSIWRVLIRPPFNTIAPAVLIRWKYLFPVISISVCILETAYSIFIWPKRTRAIWLFSVVAMHIAIGFFMGMYLFALIMITLNLAAFGAGLIPSERKRTSLRPQEVVS